MGSLLRCLLIAVLAVGAHGQASSPKPEEPPISWKQVPSDVLHSQKKIWLFPTKVARGHHVAPTILALGVTAGFVALDPTVARYFHNNSSTYHSFNNVFSASNTTLTEVGVPAIFYIVGLATKNNYTKNTGMLTAEALLDAEIPNLFLRNTTRRLRPLDALAQDRLSHTWFQTTGNPLTAKGSFPSGHTAAAFAVATVIASRYREHKWVPFVAYGLASAIGFSRTSANAHYLSDVAFGGLIGFSVSHWTVNKR